MEFRSANDETARLLESNPRTAENYSSRNSYNALFSECVCVCFVCTTCCFTIESFCMCILRSSFLFNSL